MLPHVLIVDNSEQSRAALEHSFDADGFRVTAVADSEAAMTLDGVAMLTQIGAIAPHVSVIVLVSHAGVESAGKIVRAARRVLEHGDTDARREALRWLIGPSGDVEDSVNHIGEVADSNFTIILEGETGTGKELLARAIHHLSSRYDKRFVVVDCEAIPETLIEAELFGEGGSLQVAAGGTLFFNEIVKLPLTTQAKLVRLLQEGRMPSPGGRGTVPVDVRVLVASRSSLGEEARAGRVRPDLYYRLNEFVIVLPPLRERPADIPHFARRFLAEASLELRLPPRAISEEALDVLLRYSWPGNVRELRNTIRRAAILASDIVRPEHLPGLSANTTPALAAPPSAARQEGRPLKAIAEAATAEAERWAIQQALQDARGNKTEAARRLQVDYKTLHLKMKRYRIYTRPVVP